MRNALLLLCLFTGTAGAGTISLTWVNPTLDTTAKATALTENRIYRGTKADGSDLALLQKVPVSTAFLDFGLGGTFCYAVTASNADGESAKSGVICAAAKPTNPPPVAVPAPPMAPTKLTAGPQSTP